MDIFEKLLVRYDTLIGANDIEIKNTLGLEDLSVLPLKYLKFLRLMGKKTPPMFDFDYISINDFDIVEKEGWFLLQGSNLKKESGAFPFFVTQQGTNVIFFYINNRENGIYRSDGVEITKDDSNSFEEWVFKQLAIYDSYFTPPVSSSIPK